MIKKKIFKWKNWSLYFYKEKNPLSFLTFFSGAINMLNFYLQESTIIEIA